MTRARQQVTGEAPPSEFECCADGVCPQHQQGAEMRFTRRQVRRGLVRMRKGADLPFRVTAEDQARRARIAAKARRKYGDQGRNKAGGR